MYGRLGGGFWGIIVFDGDYGWGYLGAITILTSKKNKHFELNAGCFLGGYKDRWDNYYALPIPIF